MTVGSAKDPEVIASFGTPELAKDWISVNDGVMGGISKGRFKVTETKTLLFSGDLSLENNGWFASIRTNPKALGLKGASALIVKARGDGRTYWVEVRTGRQFGASSYRAYLKTEKGRFLETRIPLVDFKLQAFGRQLPSRPIDPAAIVSIGFTLADKKEGPFSLEIENVKAAFNGVRADGDGPLGTIPEVAKKAGTFKVLLAAVEAAGLAEVLAGEGPFTVFAPTDDAFAKLPEGTVESLLKPENNAQLIAILKYHAVAGAVSLPKALEAEQASTLQGAAIKVRFADGRVRIGPAILLNADIPASNGTIHVVDTVLLPPKPEGPPKTPQALVELAIERGVPLFNDGSPGACADIYEIAVESLLLMDSVPEASQKDLRDSLVKMSAAKTASEKAWILRYALDRYLSGNPKQK